MPPPMKQLRAAVTTTTSKPQTPCHKRTLPLHDTHTHTPSPPPPPHTKAPMPTQHTPTTTSKPHTSQTNLTRPAQYTIHLLTYRRSDSHRLCSTLCALRASQIANCRTRRRHPQWPTRRTNYSRSYVATASALPTLYAYAYDARCRLQQSRHAS